MIQELDLVALLTDRPALGLRRGDVGTVVHIYGRSRSGVPADAGNDLYEVELINAKGDTVGVETLNADEVRAVDLGRITFYRLRLIRIRVKLTQNQLISLFS